MTELHSASIYTRMTECDSCYYEPCIQNKTSSSSSTSLSTRSSSSTTTTTEHSLYVPHLRQFKYCSIVMGLLVGFFIYLGTLGAEFVGIMLWGREILNKSNAELILFSLLWNFVTTCIAIIILSSMRNLVAIVFSAAILASNNSNDSRSNAEQILSELLSYMEGRFAVGALVGICLSWNVTNVVLGLKPQIVQSCIILGVACLWCRVTFVLLGTTSGRSYIHDQKDDADDKEGQEAKNQEYQLLMQV